MHGIDVRIFEQFLEDPRGLPQTRLGFGRAIDAERIKEEEEYGRGR